MLITAASTTRTSEVIKDIYKLIKKKYASLKVKSLDEAGDS